MQFKVLPQGKGAIRRLSSKTPQLKQPSLKRASQHKLTCSPCDTAAHQNTGACACTSIDAQECIIMQASTAGL